MSPFVRAVAAAVLGASAGSIFLVAAFSIHPTLALEMDRELPRFAFGFYPPEIAGSETFAWTSNRAQLNIVDLNRRLDWRCSVVLRGARPADAPQPTVSIAVDGVTATSIPATDQYQAIDVVAPANANKRGLNLAILTSPTFVPGPGDPRQLGVRVDRIQCAPTNATLVVPSRRALIDAAVIGAVFALAFALVTVTIWTAVGGALAIAAAMATAFSMGPAPYGSYPDRGVWLACWIAGGVVVLIKAIEVLQRRVLHAGARFAVTFAAGALFLKILGLLHPAKAAVDAVFHAHRLEWVMAGRYFFTQRMPNGVEFPYAIALYVAAAPWATLTLDHVTLLRVFVCIVEGLAGALLYVVVARNWNSRLTGALAVLFFNVVAMPFVVLGNANLTNAFGQAVALMTIALATTANLDRQRILKLAGLSAVASIALLSHVSTFALLLTFLVALAGFFWWPGGRLLRSSAIPVLAVAFIAATVAVMLYYGHFGEVYQHLGRTSPSAEPSGALTPFGTRLVQALTLSMRDFGAAIVVLAGVGVWRVLVEGGRDRLNCALAAWGLTYMIYFIFGVVVPVGASFERYAVEFISRVDYATYPAVVLLAARGAAWGWTHPRIPGLRVAVATLVALAVATGVNAWIAWFR